MYPLTSHETAMAARLFARGRLQAATLAAMEKSEKVQNQLVIVIDVDEKVKRSVVRECVSKWGHIEVSRTCRGAAHLVWRAPKLKRALGSRHCVNFSRSRLFKPCRAGSVIRWRYQP